MQLLYSFCSLGPFSSKFYFCSHFFKNSSAEEYVELEQTRRLKPWQLAREEMLCNRLSGLSICRVRISQEGSVAGLGLFATRDIRKGELITCYPGDALVVLEEGEENNDFTYGVNTHDVIFGPHVPSELADPVACFDEFVDYGLQEDDQYVVIGIPQLDSDTGLNTSICIRLRFMAEQRRVWNVSSKCNEPPSAWEVRYRVGSRKEGEVSGLCLDFDYLLLSRAFANASFLCVLRWCLRPTLPPCNTLLARLAMLC